MLSPTTGTSLDPALPTTGTSLDPALPGSIKRDQIFRGANPASTIALQKRVFTWKYLIPLDA